MGVSTSPPLTVPRGLGGPVVPGKWPITQTVVPIVWIWLQYDLVLRCVWLQDTRGSWEIVAVETEIGSSNFLSPLLERKNDGGARRL